jgi:transposase
MGEKLYRQYTEEFKLEALALLKSSGKPASQLERELGITDGMLLKWRDRYQVVPAEGQTKAQLQPSDLESAQREIRRLERELQEIAEEREILKK